MAVDATTLDVNFDVTANAPPEDDDIDAIKQQIADELGIDVSEIDEFEISVEDNGKHGGRVRALRARGRLLAEAEATSRWSISFTTTKHEVTDETLSSAGSSSTSTEATHNPEADIAAASWSEDVSSTLSDPSFEQGLNDNVGVPLAVDTSTVSSNHHRHRLRIRKQHAKVSPAFAATPNDPQRPPTTSSAPVHFPTTLERPWPRPRLPKRLRTPRRQPSKPPPSRRRARPRPRRSPRSRPSPELMRKPPQRPRRR